MSEISRRFAGVPHAEAWGELAQEFSLELPDDWVDAQLADCARLFAEALAPVPGMKHLLSRLTAESRAFCTASSTDRISLHRNLANAGLIPFFADNVFSASDAGKPKPEPDVYLMAAARMGFETEACLAIEDSTSGIAAARRAGIKVAGFTGGGHCYPGLDRKLRDAGAFEVFETSADLTAFLCEPPTF